MSVQEIHDHADHSDHEGHDHGDVAVKADMSRNERKSRKALLELGLKKVEGINRVVMRRSKNVGRFCDPIRWSLIASWVTVGADEDDD